MGKRKKERVLVGILAHDGNINVSLGMMLYYLPLLSHDPNHPFTYEFCPADLTRPQELARNKLIGVFLNGRYDILWQIDNDMIFRGAETFKLIETKEYDICAPLMYMFRELPQLVGVEQCVPCAGMRDIEYEKYGRTWRKITPLWPSDPTSTDEVDWVGSGCMLIRRRVLEDKRMLLAEGMDPPAFFRNVYAENGERIAGLDTDFCYRAKDLGYRIKVNWASTIGHYKTVDLNMVDLYAKISHREGYNAGVKHEVQMAAGQGRQDAGAGGVAEPDQGNNGEMDRLRLDRTVHSEAFRKAVREHAGKGG